MSRITTFLTASALALTVGGAALAQGAPADDECEDEAAVRDENGNCGVIIVQDGNALPVVGGLGGGVAIVGVLGAGLAAVALGGSGSH